ncbi:MAG: class I SAM-dependent methyltransferase [Ferruginibacter sp.]
MKRAVNFSEKIKAFEKLLDAVVIEKVSSEIYCRKYLSHLLDHAVYYLTIYADTFEKYRSHSVKQINETTLIDFGAGNGMLGIFAKFCGFKKVFINDIDEKFIIASRNLAQQLNIAIDEYITGDIHAVRSFFQNETADAIIGTDVIEHVYDLEDLFKTIGQINPSMVSVFTTASNPENYFKVKQLKKLQLRDEYKGGSPDDFILFGDKELEPFFDTRKRIIISHLENRDEETIHTLTKATRGMNEADILSAVKQFNINRTVPSIPAHPTNTCDPLTGSWTERILTLSAYRRLYDSNGMHVKVFNGFYDENKKGLKKLLNKLLNKAVNGFGIRFAPYIIFVGAKK